MSYIIWTINSLSSEGRALREPSSTFIFIHFLSWTIDWNDITKNQEKSRSPSLSTIYFFYHW